MIADYQAWATQPRFVYRHEWQVGDMVVFDTVGTVHRREAFDLGQVRTMRQLSTLLPADPP